MTALASPEAAATLLAAAPRTSPLVVRARHVPGVPVVAVRVVLPGGVRRERLPGQAYLTGRMLSEGTRRRDWRQIGEDFEARGMILTTAGTFESESVAVDALAPDWELALEWAAELVLEPSFPEERCAWARRQTEAELESMGDQPEIRTAWGFLEQLYAPHPRSRRLQGDPASLARLTSEDCAACHAASLARGGIVTVAGEIDEEAVAARAAELFAGAVGGFEPER
jgi:zinc protease